MEKISTLDEIDSIDEAEEQLDKSLKIDEKVKFHIIPETEFWAHCSNLQVWAEMEYNTKLLHRNLAFPLLRALVFAGRRSNLKIF